MPTTDFAETLHRLRLKNAVQELSPPEMVDELLVLRFPFSADSISEIFIERVRETLYALPPLLIELLYQHSVIIELDLVCEIAAIMELEKPRLLLSEHFLLERQLFSTLENPIFPYGLPGILLHEVCHWLDWNLYQNGRISGLATFQSAFRLDVAKIPAESHLSHEQRVALCERHGGYFNLPPEEKEKADLALFVLQEEETFCDAFVCLMLGHTRPVVEKYFPQSIQAVGSSLEYYLALVSESKA